jgi:hypothetical protein
MSTERDHREFERYLEYQQAQRRHRVETLGGAATVLFLSTIDLGVSGASDPSAEAPRHHEPEVAPVVELSSLRATRQRRLAGLAADASAAELGYAQAA